MRFNSWVVRCLVIVSAIAFVCVSTNTETETEDRRRNLEDKNFEHDTQLSSGATTGHWFIKFYAPWCGHCKQLGPVWKQLANDLHGEVNIAQVDVTANRALGDRFAIKSFPTLLFFADNKMHTYRGPRTIESMTEFVRDGYKKLANDNDPLLVAPIPQPPGFIKSLKYKVPQVGLKLSKDLPIVFKRYPGAACLLVATGATTGICVGIVATLGIAFIGSSSKRGGHATAAAAALSSSNSKSKKRN